MAALQRALIVTAGFGKYSKGDMIEGDLIVQAVLQGANRHRVVVIERPAATPAASASTER